MDVILRYNSERRALGAILAAALSLLSLTAAVTPAHAIAATGQSAEDRTTTSTSSKQPIGEAAASAKAVETGTAVSVDSATTPTESESANPDGSFTLVQNVAPVRKYANGVWKPLDDTLVRHADGSVSPTLTTGTLVLSGGGSMPLAEMKNVGQSMSLALPTSIATLPAPSLSGNTATYSEVLPGVDLQVAADKQGGFSEVLVVRNATAAANPALSTLNFAAKTKGVSLSTDAAGNISAQDMAGRTVFAAPAPRMWDSAASPATLSKALAGSARSSTAVAGEGTTPSDPPLDPNTGEPLISTPEAPGETAHVAPVTAGYVSGAIRLTPDSSLLRSPSAVFPLFIDPSYTAAGGVLQGWTYVASNQADTSFWKTTDEVGLRVGYQGWEPTYYTARAMAQMSVDSRIRGAQVISSKFYATESYSASCTPEPVELWMMTGKDISKDTTWNNQPAWNTKLDTQNVAHGWDGCGPASVGWDTSWVAQLAADTPSIAHYTFGLRASDEGDRLGWKKFDHSTMSMSTTYDHKPDVPTTLSTSPATTCTSSVKTIGNGDVTLYAGVSDVDAEKLTATFKVAKTVGGTVLTTRPVTAASGTKAALLLTKSQLTQWLGTTAPSGVSWNVTVSDGTYSAAASKTCSFVFDPTHPGAPTITDAQGHECGDSDPSDGNTNPPATYQVGSRADFTISRNSSSTTSYLYQLNSAAPVSTPASAGDTPIKVTPTSGTDVLTVTAVSPGGNIGDSAICFLTAAAAATAGEGDLTGDGVPDLALVGKQAGLPSGLWLAHGSSNQQVATVPDQVGSLGTGADSTSGPTAWDGTQVAVGHYNTGAGFNDILDYNPVKGTGQILFGNGDGSMLSPYSGQERNLPTNIFQDQLGNSATSIANGGNFYNVVSVNPLNGHSDLLVIIDGQLWDESSTGNGSFTGIDSGLPLSDKNPAGTGNWTGWTITSALVDDVPDLNGGVADDMPAIYARDNASGTIYYYNPTDLQNLALGSQPVTPLTLSVGAAPVLMQAADLNDDHTPDLWTVSASGTVTANLLDPAANKLNPHTPQALALDTHAWPLTDKNDGTASTAADTAGTTPLPLTGTGAGATWDSGDLFDPDLTLNGSSTGTMQTAGKVLDLTGSFTVSVWAKPLAYTGAVLSQDGSTSSGIQLIPTTAGWQFSLNTGSGTASAFDTITGGTASLAAWSHLTATFNKTTQVMNLYVDEVFVASGTHVAPTAGASGAFHLGNARSAGAASSFFQGSLSGLQTWTGPALPPNQPYTPASYHQSITPTRILDTRVSSGLAYTSGITSGTATVASGSVTPLKIAGDTATADNGANATIPDSVTSVAVDVTAVNEATSGFVTTYADSAQRPVTSSTNYTAGNIVTGYQIVPVGADGKIALYTHGGPIALVVDITGYFTSDPAAAKQTYTPLATAARVLNTLTSTANTTLASPGTVPANSTFNLKVAGVGNVPADAAAVALNITTTGATTGGYLGVYATGTTPTAPTTSLSYDTSSPLASMAADTPVGTDGNITVSNHLGVTGILVDVSGYYTTSTTGQTYHAVSPTRLVVTQSGIGGPKGSIQPFATYTLTQADIQEITTATKPTLAMMLTEAAGSAAGFVTSYPADGTRPDTSNLNWIAGAINANLAVTPTGDNGQISLYNRSSGTLDLIVDCSGYFAA